MFGYGSYDRTVATLDELFSLRDYVCGDRFTAADVYVGSAVNWGTQFGTLPQRDSFSAYTQRLTSREAFKRAMAIDDQAQAEMQAAPAQPQPA
jgi:glutathione S-transferase